MSHLRPRSYALTDGLTSRQREVVRLYAAHLLARGRPPTLREWAAALGVSFPTGIGCHVAALVKKGVIQREKSHSAGIRLVGATLRLECDGTPAGRRLARLLGQTPGETFEQGGGI